MIAELVEAAERFKHQEEWLPVFYQTKVLKWVIELSESGPRLSGPFRERDMRRIAAPVRQRSGNIGGDNIKPYLLIDDARYVLGRCEPPSGKKTRQQRQDEATAAHTGFVSLLTELVAAVDDGGLRAILRFVSKPALSDSELSKIGARDEIAIRYGSGVDFPTEDSDVQEFWQRYLCRELESEEIGTCSIRGCHDVRLLRTLPKDVVIMGQKCSLSSFNASAFTSFEKEQTVNAAICSQCAGKAIQALDYMMRERRHHSVLARDQSKGGTKHPLNNQIAVYWLKEEQKEPCAAQEIDLEEAVTAFLTERAPDQAPPEAPDEKRMTPTGDISQLERLLSLPHHGDTSALQIRDNAFYLGVLSANKGRLAVREWISVSLRELIHHLKAFAEAVRLVGPFGEGPSLHRLPDLVRAACTSDPHTVRGLVRTAYLGYPPPPQLLGTVLNRWRVPKTLHQWQSLHCLAATIKLALTYNTMEARTMQTLDEAHTTQPYLCGRLLAILERIQERAAWPKRLNTTLVDRAYGTASSAPASMFGKLLRGAEVGHLPRIRKQNLGTYEWLKRELEEVHEQLRIVGGFPRTLPMQDQAEFALGFYCQRAHFRKGS